MNLNISFKDWLDLESDKLEEGLLKNLGTAAMLTAGIWGMGKAMPHVIRPSHNVTISFDDESDREEMRAEDWERKVIIAAKLAGVPKSEMGHLEGHAIGGEVVIVNGRRVPLTAKQKVNVQQARELKARFDRIRAGHGGRGRAINP